MDIVSDRIRDFKDRDMGAEGVGWREYTYNNLSHSRAHYLMAIEALRNDLEYARTTDITEILEVSRGAASMALTQLKKRGWVTEDPNRFLLLNDACKMEHLITTETCVRLKELMEMIVNAPGFHGKIKRKMARRPAAK